MNLNKYVEIHCKNFFLQNHGEIPPTIIAKSHFPLLNFPNNSQEHSLDNLRLVNDKWHPIVDDLIFANYVTEFLQIEIHFLRSNNQQKITDQNLLGTSIVTFSKSSTFPLFDYKLIPIYKNSRRVGYITLEIFIRPILHKRSFFYKPVHLFPYATNELVVFYSGFLSDSKEVYCMFTVDDWNTHFLRKMLRSGRIWTVVIDKTNTTKQIELAFTNKKEIWDNQDNRNWLFQECNWC